MKKNLKFLSSIIDLFFFKEQKIINSKPHYRKTLIKLEREIVSFSKMYSPDKYLFINVYSILFNLFMWYNANYNITFKLFNSIISLPSDLKSL